MIKKSNKEKYHEILNAYKTEADGFGVIIESDKFPEIISNFENYPFFLKERNREMKSAKLVKMLSKGTGIIDLAVNSNPILKKILYYAHVAVCCELFDGWKIPVQSLTRSSMQKYIEKAFSENVNITREGISAPTGRYQRADAARTIQILRLLGLITVSSENIRQISFAAGNADRDIGGIHALPVINRHVDVLTNDVSIDFSSKKPKPDNLILIDSDPLHSDRYAKFNEEKGDWILAFNDYAEDAMDRIPSLIQKKNWESRNFVAGIRIDHRMVPDVPRFMSKLATTIDAAADFVFSIGAGHDVDDYHGRIIVMGELFDYLEQRGMSPVRINMHGLGDVEQQRLTPSFGYSPYTTYEIIYCKLKKKKFM